MGVLKDQIEGANTNTRPSLFECLAVTVDPLLSGMLTKLTEADGESYDRDEHLFGAVVASTLHTAAPGETYDDDPSALAGIGVAATLIDATVVTRTEPETFDDCGSTAVLSVGQSLLDSTYVTKVEGETYDDDPGLGSTGVPIS